MKKQLKKISALLIAAAVTAALAVPVLAESVTNPVGTPDGPAITSMKFNKSIEADAETYQPQVQIGFVVAGAAVSPNEEHGGEPVKQGVGTISVADINTAPEQKGTKVYSTDFDFTQIFTGSDKITQPGVYKYTVTETLTPSLPDLETDTALLYIYVRQGASGLEVYGSALIDPKQAGAKTGVIQNVYKHSGKDPSKTFRDLTIEKEVAGAQADDADRTRLFDFVLTIASGSGRTTYAVSTTRNGSAATLTAGVPYTFKLKHGETVKVENLSSADTYTVTETNVDNHFTVTGDVKNAKAMNADADVTEKITNTRRSATPTGILMDYGPYALMVAAAIVLAMVFFRRRREEA